MGTLNIEKQVQDTSLTLKLSGQIDEDVNFGGIDLSQYENVVFDFDGIKVINSVGIREWIQWVSGAQSAKIIFKNCPKVIVDQINMVEGFLPKGAEVHSFYVPYFCEENDNEKMILFERGRQFTEGQVTPPEEVLDDESGEPMEMDVIESKYFKFIQS